jgi:hypothetical protein
MITGQTPIPICLAWHLQVSGRALLPPGVEERVVVIRDDEPTSVVAYFLSTR